MPDREQIESLMKTYNPEIIGSSSTINTSVMIPLTHSSDSVVEVILQKRADHLDIQPGDICFPGGFQDSNDDSARETALRETTEELGLNSDDIEVFGEFDSLMVPWHITITSYVGWVKDSSKISPDTTEVAEVFKVDLDTVINQEPEEHDVELIPAPDDDFPFEKIPGGKDYDWQPRFLPELFYDFNDHHVW